MVPHPVMLHIYDLSTDPDVKAVNRVLRSALGTGAFHCGVEVYMKEWSFRKAKHGTGVFWEFPRRCPGASYSDSIFMGNTLMSESEVLSLIQAMALDWQGKRYNILKRNCCHFSAALCKHLGAGETFPEWCLNLASTGNDIVEGVGVMASEVDNCGKCVKAHVETLAESAQVQSDFFCGTSACCVSPSKHRALPVPMGLGPRHEWEHGYTIPDDVVPARLVSGRTDPDPTWSDWPSGGHDHEVMSW